MFHSETNLANTDYRENRSMILSGLSLWEKGSTLHKSTQQVRTQGPIRHADCRQRKLADFLCTGGIIQGQIRRSRRIRHWRTMPDATLSASYQAYTPGVIFPTTGGKNLRS
ncbi:hypothetical protein, partial [Klebsiella pneumoniae]|uniref:hypothetical protein n=1 Tax=Klebsiella pneumoniae TaxID=573 RepID=UPI001D0E7BF2